MSYDIETMLNDVKALLVADLNTKIAAINTEKSDTITLRTIDASAYFMDMDDQSANFDPVVLYGVGNIEGSGIGPATSKIVTINISIILSDDGIDLNIIKRMLRYGRALEEVIEAKWARNRPCGNFQVESLPILGFQRSDTSLRYKIVGINLVTSLA